MNASLKVLTWNVNGIRAILSKDKQGTKINSCLPNVLESIIEQHNPDIICLQEIKCSNDIDIQNLLSNDIKGAYPYITQSCATVRKGYSGTAIISKHKPLNIICGFGDIGSSSAAEVAKTEGRIITFEFPDLYVSTVYTPNSKPDLSRLGFRTKEWDVLYKEFLIALQKSKPVVACGDYNVAPADLDVHNPKTAKGSHGFTEEEKTAFQNLLKEANLSDAYRTLYPRKQEYTWYSPFAQSRQKNKGWRIDHFLVSKALKPNKVDILSNFWGSDHVPVLLTITINSDNK